MSEYAIHLLNEAIADLSLRCEPSPNARTQFTADENKARMAQLQAAVDTLKQQPATHGEPVAWMYDWLPAGGPTSYDWISGDKGEVFAPENGYFNIRPLYTSPQPTPEHIRAMKQTLEALETDGWQKKMQASINLQNVLKDQ